MCIREDIPNVAKIINYNDLLYSYGKKYLASIPAQITFWIEKFFRLKIFSFPHFS